MIYIPIGRNEFIAPYPKKAVNTAVPLALRLPVLDYLSAYGLRVTNTKKLPENHSDAQKRKDLSKWIIEHYNDLKLLLERFSKKLRKHRDDKSYSLAAPYEPQNTYEKELFEKAGFLYKNGGYSKDLIKSDISYLTGGWLEEWGCCYF